jgi:hypothetical protein
MKFLQKKKKKKLFRLKNYIFQTISKMLLKGYASYDFEQIGHVFPAKATKFFFFS